MSGHIGLLMIGDSAHSWGASVAVALALKFPDLVRGLVLASGYYHPTMRADLSRCPHRQFRW
jgi:pimeloyl-ACP methyl ester carboxylesterase